VSDRSALASPVRAVDRGPADPLLLDLRGLSISVRSLSGADLPVVQDAELRIPREGSVGLVGESGSGKTMLCRSLIGTLRRHGASITAGSIVFDGTELVGAPARVYQRLRGREIGYVSQSSLAGLNPILTVRQHLTEVVRLTRRVGRTEAAALALELLEQVRIPRAKEVLESHPHQLSGGMRQRVVIACAIARHPKLLVADEPTTALDVTVQREVLKLIVSLREEFAMALLLISHDAAVIEDVCELVTVMYAGATVEHGPVVDIKARPAHPYTAALHGSRVDIADPGAPLRTVPGEPIAVGHWPEGCRFAPRCPRSDELCTTGDAPRMRAIGAGRWVACHHPQVIE
jgi:oligopeptide/dipeptide ABC transporter ATP-binding protein